MSAEEFFNEQVCFIPSFQLAKKIDNVFLFLVRQFEEARVRAGERSESFCVLPL